MTTTAPTVNADLLRRVMAHIEAHPEQHDQQYFATRDECGTRYCVAGWTVKLADPDAQFWFTRYTDDRDAATELTDGRDVQDEAARLLGLDGRQVGRLFYDAKTLDEVRTEVAAILADAPAVTG